jgi:hypothetical protein
MCDFESVEGRKRKRGENKQQQNYRILSLSNIYELLNLLPKYTVDSKTFLIIFRDLETGLVLCLPSPVDCHNGPNNVS